MFTLPLLEAEDGISFSQRFLWNQKIDYHVHRASSRARRFITVFTKPPIEPEDPLWLQSLLMTQKIHYHVYKASYWARRSMIVFTMPVTDPEYSLPCLQSLLWSLKTHYRSYSLPCLQNTPVFPSALGISIDPFQVTGLERSFQNPVVTCWTNWLYRLWSSGIGSSHSHWMLKFHIFSFAALLCWRHCLQRGSSNRNR